MEPSPAHVRARYAPLRLDSIRSRILAFALLATLLPSSITLGVSYVQNRRALEEKISQDLVFQSAQAAGVVSVWLKERLYDLRVFAGSDEVANNLALGVRGTPTAGRLRDYLVSLHERFVDFDQLAVLDLQGRVIATSIAEVRPVALPPEWVQSLRSDGQIVGEPYWDAKAKKAKVILAVPVQGPDGRPRGAFAAELDLALIQRLLRAFTRDSSGVIYAVSESGAPVARTDGMTQALMRARLPRPTHHRLLGRENQVIPYSGIAYTDVVGTAKRVPQASWTIVAEVAADAAFAQVRAFRDLALLAIAALLVLAAASAYRLGRLIVRPLDRLIVGASEVAAGDLAVDLPETGRGEVASLTRVFNHMVSRLREGRRELDTINDMLRQKNEELERLSVTDSLTGLANHRALMHRLEAETTRYGRTRREFSVLMADVDDFKQYNDAFGHPAGDEVLRKVGAILRDLTRAVDCVARYGGEEFAIIMPETGGVGAAQVAERIRARVAADDFPGRRVTLSIGVAEFPLDADSPQTIIAAADEALYRAKRAGRDRVELRPPRAKTKR